MLEIKGNKVLVGPLLIRRGQLLRLELLTDGTPHLSCPHPPLINVTIREGEPSRTPYWVTLMPTMIGVAFFGLTLWALSTRLFVGPARAVLWSLPAVGAAPAAP